jgi:hypothetical protein
MHEDFWVLSDVSESSANCVQRNSGDSECSLYVMTVMYYIYYSEEFWNH